MTEDDVKWIVNDFGELGVEVNGRFLFLYKGDSLEYGKHAEIKDGVCLHDDGTPMQCRMVGKREFGETCKPALYYDKGYYHEGRYTEPLVFHEGLSFGKPEDGDWKPLPASNVELRGRRLRTFEKTKRRLSAVPAHEVRDLNDMLDGENK